MTRTQGFFDFSLFKKSAIVLLVWMLGFFLAVMFFACYFPSIFHGDAASHQILAQAMVDEMKFIPHDFFYGNQLILFRSNFFIAVALKLGLVGYKAFIIGSSLNFSVFFVITFAVLEACFADWVKSLFITVLLFLPMGESEADYIIGQQSHLANVVFCLTLVVSTYFAYFRNKRAAFTIAAAFLFFIALEEPVRALLVLVPLLSVMFLNDSTKKFYKVAIIYGLVFLIGYVFNYWLVKTHHVVGLSVVWRAPISEFLLRIIYLLILFVEDHIGLVPISELPKHLFDWIQYVAKFFVLAAFAKIFVSLVQGLLIKAMPKSSGPNPNELCIGLGKCGVTQFIGFVGFVGVVFGFILTSSYMGRIDPEIRHFLWAIQLVKLLVIIYLYSILFQLITNKAISIILLLIFMFAVSSVTTFLFHLPKGELSQYIGTVKLTPIDKKIHDVMRDLHVNKIYSPYFWQINRYDVIIPPVKSGVLFQSRNVIYPTGWLSRPSKYFVTGRVLYLLKNDLQSRKYASDLLAKGGKLIVRLDSSENQYRRMKSFAKRHSVSSWSIYLGPPIWSSIDHFR
jgi:hypothetical protein